MYELAKLKINFFYCETPILMMVMDVNRFYTLLQHFTHYSFQQYENINATYDTLHDQI